MEAVAPPALDRGLPTPFLPQAATAPLPPADFEALRRAHLSTEARLRAFGALLLAVGLVNLLAWGSTAYILVLHLLGVRDSGWLQLEPASLDFRLKLNVLVDILIWIGIPAITGFFFFWLRRGTRLLTTLAAPAFFFFVDPITQIACVLAIWQVHSPKGRRVLAADYRTIRAATPQVRAGWSILTWIGLWMGLVALVILYFYAVHWFVG